VTAAVPRIVASGIGPLLVEYIDFITMDAIARPLVDRGAAGAATGCVQMTTGAVVSGLVAMLSDQHSALSMTALMAACSLVALAAYLLLARPAERAVMQA